MSLSVYVTGLLTGLSLIVAIGAQNAFVLRQITFFESGERPSPACPGTP